MAKNVSRFVLIYLFYFKFVLFRLVRIHIPMTQNVYHILGLINSNVTDKLLGVIANFKSSTRIVVIASKKNFEFRFPLSKLFIIKKGSYFIFLALMFQIGNF